MGRPRKRLTHLPRHMMLRHGTYYYVVRVAGKQRWIALGKDYGAALRQWAELDGAQPRPLRTVSDALTAYLADRAPKRSSKTMRDYRAQAARLDAVFGRMRLDEVKRAHVFEYLQRRGNVSGNRERDLLRAVYNHAANLGYEGPNPCAGMRYRNPERPRQRYVTDDELAALVLAAKPRLAALILFLYLTGMRVSDAIALPIGAADNIGIHWQEGKTARKRLVQWSAELHRVWDMAVGARRSDSPAFLGQRGPYTLDGLESSWARVRERSGVCDVRLHDLRRKAASDLPLEHAQRLLGHASPGITQRIYRARPDPVKPTR